MTWKTLLGDARSHVLAGLFEARGWVVRNLEISDKAFTWEGVYPGVTARYIVEKYGFPGVKTPGAIRI